MAQFCNSGRLATFLENEDGAGTIWGLLSLAVFAMLSGYAIDVSNVMTARTNLQIVADSSAHAALVKREYGRTDDAVAAAIALAKANLSEEKYGTTISGADVVFGVWDAERRQFAVDANSRSAVQVTANQTAENGNSLGVFLLQFVGMTEWNVATKATYTTYQPTCLREGFVADGVVDIQSNNTYVNGFCIHSNTYVSLNSNNYFEPGTIVSMPDLSQLELPNSGYKTNIGLEQALRTGEWNIKIIDRISSVINSLEALEGPYVPDYITGTVPVALKPGTVTQAMLKSGRMHVASCVKSNDSLTIGKDVLVSKVVIVTNCEVKFAQGVALEDAIIATKNTGSKSLNSPSGLRLGKNDNCAEGGGAQLVTRGSAHMAGGLQMYGSQILAAHNIDFAAQANGIQGAAMVAGARLTEPRTCRWGSAGKGWTTTSMRPISNL